MFYKFGIEFSKKLSIIFSCYLSIIRFFLNLKQFTVRFHNADSVRNVVYSGFPVHNRMIYVLNLVFVMPEYIYTLVYTIPYIIKQKKKISLPNNCPHPKKQADPKRIAGRLSLIKKSSTTDVAHSRPTT